MSSESIKNDNTDIVADRVADRVNESFKGSYEHLLDDKGRLNIPSSFRASLGNAGKQKVIITNFITDGARCLDGFSVKSWLQFEEKLKTRSRFDPQLRKLESYYISRAQECQLDSSGRILVPQNLRTYAGLEKEVVFTSTLHGFRLWDKRVWELVFCEAESALLENPALFIDVDR